MAEFRTILETASRTLPAPRRSLDDLLRLQTRKRRNKRITAGIVALIVAAAGTLTAIAAFGPANGRPSHIGRGGFFAVWPEQLPADTFKAQARVDRGEDPWRLSAEGTARQFARQVLGFAGDQVTPCVSFGHSPPTPRPPGHCFETANDPIFDISVVQLGRLGGGGIWSVTEVNGGGFWLELHPGDSVRAGSVIRGAVEGPDTQGNYFENSGVVLFRECGPQTLPGETERTGLAIASTGLKACGSDQAIPLTKPTPGLAFIFRTNGEGPGMFPAGFGMTPPGIPLFLPFGEPGLHVVAMSMVPVMVLPAAPASVVTDSPTPSPSPSPTPPRTYSPPPPPTMPPTTAPASGLNSSEYRISDGWAVRYPSNWRRQEFDRSGRVHYRGAIFTNLDRDLVEPNEGPGNSTWQWDWTGIDASRAVAMQVEFDEGGPSPVPEADTPLPLHLSDFTPGQSANGSPPEIERVFWHGGVRFVARVWIGDQATQADRDAVRAMVESISFP